MYIKVDSMGAMNLALNDPYLELLKAVKMLTEDQPLYPDVARRRPKKYNGSNEEKRGMPK